MSLTQIGRTLAVLSAGCLTAATMTGCASKRHGHTDLESRLAALEGSRGKVTSTSSYSSRMHGVPSGMKGAAMALPTGTESSSSILVEKFVPALVAPGENYEYQILVTNLTDSLYFQGVEVRDRFAGEYALASSTPEGRMDGSTGVWNLGTLAPAETKTITIKGAVSGSGEVSSCTTIVYDPVLCLAYEAEKAVLQANCAGDTNVTACEEIKYTISVRNSGSGAAKNVVVTNNLPSGLEPVGSTTASLGDIPGGESRDASFTVKPTAGGSYTASIRVTGDNVEPVECASITTNVCAPAVSVDLSGTSYWYIGNEGAFKATVKNTSGCDTDNVTLTASLPSNTSYASSTEGGSGSGSSIRWNIGKMAAGEEKTVEFRLGGTVIGEGNVSVSAKGDCAPEVTDQEPVTTKGIPAILLEVIDVTDPVRVGDATTYVIIATNQGSAVGTGIKIVGRVEEMTVTNAAGATDGSITAKEVTFAPLASLAPGAKAEWRVTVKVDAAGDQRFFVEMNTDQLSRPVNETEATNCYE